MDNKAETVYTLTVINNYEIIEHRSFAYGHHAREVFNEYNEKLFGDKFREAKDKYEEFDSDSTVLDYQGSEAWWDNDCRTKVFLEKNIVEYHI